MRGFDLLEVYPRQRTGPIIAPGLRSPCLKNFLLAKQPYFTENIVCRVISERKENDYETGNNHHVDITADCFNNAFASADFAGEGYD